MNSYVLIYIPASGRGQEERGGHVLEMAHIISVRLSARIYSCPHLAAREAAKCILLSYVSSENLSVLSL